MTAGGAPDGAGRGPARLPPLGRVAPPTSSDMPATPRPVAFICHGPSCGERGGEALLAALAARQQAEPGRARVLLCSTSCMDHCATGPNVMIGHEDGVQGGLLPENAEAIWEFLAGEQPSD